MGRAEIAQRVIEYFAQHFHMPTSWFKEDTNLRDDLLYSDHSLVTVGSYINQSNWTPVWVTPSEIVACKTIGDVIELVDSKQ